MHFTERAFKGAFGATVIQSRLQPSPGRQGLKSSCFPELKWAFQDGSDPTAKEAVLASRVQMPSARPRSG